MKKVYALIFVMQLSAIYYITDHYYGLITKMYTKINHIRMQMKTGKLTKQDIKTQIQEYYLMKKSELKVTVEYIVRPMKNHNNRAFQREQLIDNAETIAKIDIIIKKYTSDRKLDNDDRTITIYINKYQYVIYEDKEYQQKHEHILPESHLDDVRYLIVELR